MSAIKLEGFKEFQKAVRIANGGKLPKEIGRAHKQVGEFVISKLRPAPVPGAVGAGSGATVRPSASSREVLLRVGGGHRKANFQQWGRRGIRPQTPGRPYIVNTAKQNEAGVLKILEQRVDSALNQAFKN
jgi:hypothetical protein